ncbi:hypothetical protein ALC56_02825 [Trachymyrmex septentrionalis]|uniref:Uncharacterized protein n=1 Tax=Trachymyrmex septentrionalis TaxID=34720 RepID=A0A195FR06_9HYME|nr:hypothetical protein ALC56_02825 [Trachymyrmex septentrionalis]
MANAVNGKALFMKMCISYHGKGEKHKIGPTLYGIMGKTCGTISGETRVAGASGTALDVRSFGSLSRAIIEIRGLSDWSDERVITKDKPQKGSPKGGVPKKIPNAGQDSRGKKDKYKSRKREGRRELGEGQEKETRKILKITKTLGTIVNFSLPKSRESARGETECVEMEKKEMKRKQRIKRKMKETQEKRKTEKGGEEKECESLASDGRAGEPDDHGPSGDPS